MCSDIENVIKSVDIPTAYMQWTEFNFEDSWQHWGVYSDAPANNIRINGRIAETQESAYLDIYTRIKNDPIIESFKTAFDNAGMVWDMDAPILDDSIPSWIHYTFTIWE